MSRQISSLKQSLLDFPPGELELIKNGNYVKWFQKDGRTRKYIPKSEQKFTEKLAVKKLFQSRLKKLENELELMDEYLTECHIQNDDQKNSLLKSNEFQNLLEPYLREHPDPVTKFLTSEYPQNPFYPNHLIHKTLAGHMVRSKSEVIIANALFVKKIPYIYERGLTLGESLYFPDFTICHPKSFELIYWEHFGKMDDASYSDKAYNKLKQYSYHGIIPTINLITTYEDLAHPLNSFEMEQIIERYFC